MEENNNLFTVVDAEGNEKQMYILFTYTDEDTNKNYVFYFDPEDEEHETFVSGYDEEGNLFPVEEDSEWEKLEEVFESYQKDMEEGHHCCGHEHGEGCCHHEHNEECDCEHDDDHCCCHKED